MDLRELRCWTQRGVLRLGFQDIAFVWAAVKEPQVSQRMMGISYIVAFPHHSNKTQVV